MLNQILNKKVYIFSAIGVILIVFLFVFISMTFNRNTFYDGVYIEGISLSGLHKDEAAQLLKKRLEDEYLNQNICLTYNGEIWNYSFSDFSVKFLTSETIDTAYGIGHHGNIFKRLHNIITTKVKHNNIDIEISYDSDKIRKKLNDLKQKIDKSPENAKVIYNNGQIKLLKDKIGQLLNVDNNVIIVENHIIKRDFSEIILKVDEIKPKITYNQIQNINSVLSTFNTEFDSTIENRTHNISISCSRINGTLLMPGDIFSMNETLGPRTAENGYKEAKIILQNDFVNGIGGGVCQVTTTLYDSVLLSMLDVLERTPHSLVPQYVQPGQDATIADDSIDFKFQNNKDYPISIFAEVRGGTLSVRILGKKDTVLRKVRLVSKIVKQIPPGAEEIKIDDSIPDNEKRLVRKPQDGCVADLFREIYDMNGILLKKEKISESSYKPVTAQYKINKNYLVNSQSEGVS